MESKNNQHNNKCIENEITKNIETDKITKNYEQFNQQPIQKNYSGFNCSCRNGISDCWSIYMFNNIYNLH